MSRTTRLAKDVDIPIGRIPNGPWVGGFDSVLEVDDFDSGFSGWQDHTEYDVANSSTRAYPPIGLTSERTAFQSRHALVLGTSSARADTPDKGGSCISFKRGVRTFETGYLAVFWYWTLRMTDEIASPNRFKFDIDSQARDDNSRYYGSLALRRWVGSSPDTFEPRWSVRDYDGPEGAKYKDIPGTALPESPAVPGKGDIFGWNENKAGFSWAGLVMNLDGANGGSYHRAFTGSRWFDLTSLGANTYETPQRRNPGTGSTSFAMGENVGAAIYNRNANDDGPARLIIGSMVKLHYPEGTVFPS